MKRISILGAAGRMGRALIAEIAKDSELHLSGALERSDSLFIGKDAGVVAGLDAGNLLITHDVDAVFSVSDAVIDFTSPDYTALIAAKAADYGIAHISGTTGLELRHFDALKSAAQRIPVMWSANMSVGVNLLQVLVEQAARSLSDDYDIEIVEMHHRHKVDAPSGTALALGRSAAAGRGVNLEDVRQDVRSGQTGARPRGEIGFATLRGGDVVGDHSVIFAADGERIELGHKASSRQVFAVGAVRAAKWATLQPAGFYSMRDVLGMA